MTTTRPLAGPAEAVACDNCVWTGVGAELKPIVDIEERVFAGEKVPAGECPDCGCLAHIMPNRWKVSDTITFERIIFVDANSEEEAIEKAEQGIGEAEEQQIDNTPWQAERVGSEPAA